jgi:hypothetical protein
MANPLPTDAEQLRRFGQSIVDGSQGLTPIVNDFFAVENGTITGCCALGGAILAISPHLRSAHDLHSDFGQMDSGNNDLLKPLLEEFPVLGTTTFNELFIAKLAELDSCPGVSEIDATGDYNLINVVSTVFQAALNTVADGLCASKEESVH